MNDSQPVAEKFRQQSTSMNPEAAKAPAERPSEGLRELIVVAAYYRAESRNFEPGHELEDWLDAEAQVLAQAQAMKGFPA